MLVVVGEEVAQAMIQLTLEQSTVPTSVHRDTTCWMSSFVSRLDYALWPRVSVVLVGLNARCMLC